jgi:prepilin peptidase CpaA
VTPVIFNSDHFLLSMPFFIATLLTLLIMFAMVTDLATYRIPNKINGAILVLYPIACLILPEGAAVWKDGLLGFLILFTIGNIIFRFRIMGGGDVKMIAVLALWVGYGMSLVNFVTLFGLLGGILTLFLLSLRKLTPYVILKLKGEQGTIPRVLSYNEPLPYGVAIGLAFLWMLWNNMIPLLPVLSQ